MSVQQTLVASGRVDIRFGKFEALPLNFLPVILNSASRFGKFEALPLNFLPVIYLILRVVVVTLAWNFPGNAFLQAT